MSDPRRLLDRLLLGIAAGRVAADARRDAAGRAPGRACRGRTGCRSPRGPARRPAAWPRRGGTRRRRPRWPTPGGSVVVATGTASGKSLAYQLPGLTALLADERARVLYLAPTKALAGDQLRALAELALPGVAGGHLRRRHARRGARLGPRARQLGAHQPRHAAPRDPAGARALGAVLPAAALRRDRRVPRLPRPVRLARGAGPAAAAAGVRVLRRRRRCSCWRRRRWPTRQRSASRLVGAAGRGGHRRRLAARADDVRAVGAAADRRCAASTTRRCAVRPGPRPAGCWPTWSSRGPARWPSSARGAGRS